MEEADFDASAFRTKVLLAAQDFLPSLDCEQQPAVIDGGIVSRTSIEEVPAPDLSKESALIQTAGIQTNILIFAMIFVLVIIVTLHEMTCSIYDPVDDLSQLKHQNTLEMMTLKVIILDRSKSITQSYLQLVNLFIFIMRKFLFYSSILS